jgi:hypothetical protein
MWRRMAAAALCACLMCPLAVRLLLPDPGAALPPCCSSTTVDHVSAALRRPARIGPHCLLRVPLSPGLAAIAWVLRGR